jgi:hypothetical protein
MRPTPPSQLDRGLQRICEGRSPRGFGRPERRRVRGVAVQSVFVALLLAAANLRKIATFVQEQAAIEAGTLRRFFVFAPRRQSVTGYLRRRRWGRAQTRIHR